MSFIYIKNGKILIIIFLLKALHLGFAEMTEDPPGPIQVVPKED